MRRLLPGLAAALALLAPATAAADPMTGRLLVTVEPGTSARATASALSLAGARAAGPRVPEIGLVTVRAAPGRTLAETARALRRRGSVARVQPERRARLRLQPDDPALAGPELSPGTPPGTAVQWWAARTGLYAAWDVTRGAGATVAVIDTGVDAAHPELAGKIAAAADHDGEPGHGPATYDENGHGTHVASIACAAGDNATAIVGAGLDCRLVVVKTDLTDASVAASIVEAVNRGADAINMSFGTDGTRPPAQAIRDAIEYAVTRDRVLVAAAADAPTEEQGDPANLLQPTGTGPDLTLGKGLSVTAANLAGARASFAGRGTQISMAAYGQLADAAGPPGLLGAFPANATDLERGGGVLLPGPACGCRAQFAGDSRYAYLQGTSMAAPMVAAVAALMRRLNPDARAPDIVRMLKQTATRPAGGGWTPELGWGILDAAAAVRAARDLDRRAPSSRLRGPARVRRARTVTVRWSGRDARLSGLKPSGIAAYELLRSTGRGPYKFITRTRRTRVRLRVRPGVRYRFYTVAVDRAGNREAVPPRPDLTTRVARR